VAEIQELIPNGSWRLIPGALSPADCASKGMSANELLHYDLWWRGPEILSQPGLPLFFGIEIPPTVDMEERSKLVLTVRAGNSNNDVFMRYSSHYKLKRVVVTVLRYRYNCHAKAKLQDRKKGTQREGDWRCVHCAYQTGTGRGVWDGSREIFFFTSDGFYFDSR
jgi:hypothetical protein